MSGSNANTIDTEIECDIEEIDDFQKIPHLFRSKNCLIPDELKPYFNNFDLVYIIYIYIIDYNIKLYSRYSYFIIYYKNNIFIIMS